MVKNKFSLLIGFIIIVFMCLNLTSCTNNRGREPYIVYQKSVLLHNPYLSSFIYTSNGFDIIEVVDSTTRYNIGDDVRKYSTKK
jgi:hypothetical protein